MEEIYELIDQLAAKVFEKFGNATSGTVTFYTDGYRSVNVIAMENNLGKPVEAWKRRELYDASRCFCSGQWSEDRSEAQNDYYRRLHILLEDDE